MYVITLRYRSVRNFIFDDVFVVLYKRLKGKRIGMGFPASTDIYEAMRKSIVEALTFSLKTHHINTLI